MTSGAQGHRGAEGPRHRDEGSALLLVMAMISTLLVLVTVSLTYAQQTQGVATRSKDWNQALAAAQSGIDDYLARLNRNDLYWRTLDCGNVAMRRAYTTTNACGWNATTATGWLEVPGSRGTVKPRFHYDVDASQTSSDGTIDLVSTGRSGALTRTVQATLRRKGFGEFLYYTDLETIDPANEVVYGYNNTDAQNRCPRYAWASPTRPSGCEDVNFTTNDRLNGPVHTNDELLIQGRPTFTGQVTTSRPACRSTTGGTVPATRCYRANGTANPDFQKGVSYREVVPIPESTTSLRQYVTPGATDNLGCLYTGPTRIRFRGDATMQVWSPWTLDTVPRNPACGSRSALASSSGASVALPTGKLIYVQDVPSSQSEPSSGRCGAGDIGDSLPLGNDANRSLREYDCRYGTVYVQGTVKGRVSVAAENNVVITDDLLYAGGKNGTDALGLIASNSVQIYHPVTSGGNNLNRPWGGKFTSPQIYAAILTLRHSFGVQYYAEGDDLGTIYLYGSIAQRFRGPVGTGSSSGIVSGYYKDYNYDSRLRYSPPPYFLDPVQSGWGQKTFGEIAARYR